MNYLMPDSENRIADLLRAERADSFSPFFSDRVMKRIGALGSLPVNDEIGTLYDALRWVFFRASLACVVLIVVVGLFNLFDFGVSDAASWVDALLGLPSDDLADMLTYHMI